MSKDQPKMTTRSQSPVSHEEALKLIEKLTQRIAELEGGEAKSKDELVKHVRTINDIQSELKRANEETKIELEKERKIAQDKLLKAEDELKDLRTERLCLNYKLESSKAELASKERYLDDNARILLEKDREIEELRRQRATSSIGGSAHQNGIKPSKSESETEMKANKMQYVAKYPENQRDESSSPEQSPKVTRVKKLVTNLSIFSGKVNENVSEWIYMADCAFEYNRLNEKEMFNIAIFYLKDSAHLAYRSYKERCIEMRVEPSWNNLKAEFMRLFGPVDHLDHLRIKLDNLKQTGSLDDYIANFRVITTQISRGMSDDEKRHRFIEGLNEVVRTEVRFRKSKNLEEAIELAVNVDRTMKMSGRQMVKPESALVVSRKGRDYRNDAPRNHSSGGHKGKFTRHKSRVDNNSRPRRPITCYKCGKPGHVSKNCRVQTNNSVQKKRQVNRFS